MGFVFLALTQIHYFLNNYFLRQLILEAYEKENIYICQAIADGTYPIVLPCS